MTASAFHTSAWAAVACCALALVGCGSKKPVVIQPTSPFTAQHALVFENGVDLVTDPERLEGRWRGDWARELEARVEQSDLIALVRTRTLHTDTDLEMHTSYRLVAEPKRSLVGEPGGNELTLAVAEDDPGYNSVHSQQRQLLDRTFVAFIKWVRDENGRVIPRWHLAPASDPVLERTEYLVSQKRRTESTSSRRVVTVHEN